MGESYEKRTWWSKYRLAERSKSQTFVEAAVTAAFVIAAADGTASAEEYDALRDRLEILGGVDSEKIDEYFTAAANQLEGKGFATPIAHVAALVDDKEGARAAFVLAMAIALADDDVSAEEREVAKELADGIGLGGVDLDSLIAEIRG
jgi:tellurite resistance protein